MPLKQSEISTIIDSGDQVASHLHYLLSRAPQRPSWVRYALHLHLECGVHDRQRRAEGKRADAWEILRLTLHHLISLTSTNQCGRLL